MNQNQNNRTNRLDLGQFTAVSVAVVLCGYLLVTSTVTLHETLWLYDVKRILQLILLPVLFLVVLLVPALRAAFSRQLSKVPAWLATIVLSIIGLGIASSFLNTATPMALAYSLADVFLLVLLVVAMFCVAACRSLAGEKFDRTALVLLALISMAVGFQELLGVLAAWNSGLEFNPRVALLHFSWPRFYNQVQSWSLPVLAALPLVMPGKPLVKLLFVVAAALGWYVVIATGGRGTAVGVGLAILIIAILFPTGRKALLGYQLLGLVAGILIYLAIAGGHEVVLDDGPGTSTEESGLSSTQQSPDRPTAVNVRNDPMPGDALPGVRSRVEKPPGEYPSDDLPPHDGQPTSGTFTQPVTGQRMWTSSGRMDMWRGSVRDSMNHPWLGIGPMNYACKGPSFRAAHPHSFPLQFASEWGIPAFLLLLMVLLICAKQTWVKVGTDSSSIDTSSTGTGKIIGTALATGILAAGIHACLSGVLIMPASQVCGVLILGWFLGLPTTKDITSRGNNRMAVGTLIVAVLIASLFLEFTWQQIAVSEAQLKQTRIMDQLIPRLWQNGKVCQLYQGQPSD